MEEINFLNTDSIMYVKIPQKAQKGSVFIIWQSRLI
jgi:hypothetical protein